jgi:protein ImuB
MFACIYSQSVSDSVLLQDFAYSFSPLVEETAADTVVLDVEGCDLLFGSAYELSKVMAGRAVKPKQSGGLGCKINVAIAANPDAAIHAARFLEGITFISPGEELTGLGDLPIEVLCFELVGVAEKKQAGRPQSREEILETLKLWGIRTFREFATLPVAGVSERLGQEGVKLQQLAAGKTDRHLKLIQPAPVFENSLELEYPIAELEPLSFILARLLNQLCASLNTYSLATNELRLSLKLGNGATHERKLNLPYPMRDHKVFLKLLLLDTEMHPPQAAVNAVAIAFEPVKPRVLQNGLFIPLAPEPEKLELTLMRLAKLLGQDSVGSLELVDTNRPDAFRVKRFGLKARIDGRKRRNEIRNSQSTIRNSKCLLGFRVFRPPLRAIVQAEHGSPTQISAWGPSRSVYGKVVRVAGPWRTTGDWWRTDAWARDEWDVAVESSRSSISNLRSQDAGSTKGAPRPILFRIYRELRSGVWFVEGVYD